MPQQNKNNCNSKSKLKRPTIDLLIFLELKRVNRHLRKMIKLQQYFITKYPPAQGE